jgi:hypothetical protein
MRLPVLLAAVAALLLSGSTASAATTLGQTAVGTEPCGSANTLAWQTSAPYLAPGPGVITQLRTSSGTAGAVVSLKVVRPGTSTILFSTAAQTVPTAGAILSVNVQVPVQAGDTIGYWLGTADNICALPTTSASDTIAGISPSADQPAGPITGSGSVSASVRLAVAATWEPDADGDGFGDDSQDGCPRDAAITTGSCEVDGALTATASPSSVPVGDIAVVELSAASPASHTLRGATLSAALPAGLELVLASPRSCVFSGALACNLGDFSGSREAVLAVRGKTVGSQALSASLAATSPDPNLANNAVSVPITVTAAEGGCKVPKLKGRTKSFAKALLKAAGCKLGKVKHKTVTKGRNGRVRSQTVKAGTRVPAGTKVGVTLNRRR